jgi:hypothetical protein
VPERLSLFGRLLGGPRIPRSVKVAISETLNEGQNFEAVQRVIARVRDQDDPGKRAERARLVDLANWYRVDLEELERLPDGQPGDRLNLFDVPANQSGGEKQRLMAILFGAGVAHMFGTNDPDRSGDALGLMLLDEAFSNLDPEAAEAAASLPVLEFDCDPASFIRWPERTHTLLILENEAPFRRLDPRPGYALAWGCGHAARATLPELNAVTRIRLLYWGDCDSHGYAILNGLRGDLPDLHSVGMGIDTVLKSAGSLIREANSERIEIAMPRLTDAEAAGRGHLMRNHARLEQERVPVDERDLFLEPTLA